MLWIWKKKTISKVNHVESTDTLSLREIKIAFGQKATLFAKPHKHPKSRLNVLFAGSILTISTFALGASLQIRSFCILPDGSAPQE